MKRNRPLMIVVLGTCVVILCPFIVRCQSSMQTKNPVTVEAERNGAHGYHPVAFFTEGKGKKRDPQWQVTYGGATYHFQSSYIRDMSERTLTGMRRKTADTVRWL